VLSFISLSLHSILFLFPALCLFERGKVKMADFEYVIRADATEMKGPKPPLDFSYHYSRVTAARKESSVKSFYKYFQIPGIGNLAGGMFGNCPRHTSIDLKRIPTLSRNRE
jgi:hypothetical protein